MTFDALITKYGNKKVFKRYDYDNKNWTQDQINEISTFSNELSQAINNRILLTGIKLNNSGKFESKINLPEIKVDQDEVYYFADKIKQIILASNSDSWQLSDSQSAWETLLADASLSIKKVGGEVVPEDFYNILNLSEDITSTLEFENESIILIQNKFKVEEEFYERLARPDSLSKLSDVVSRQVPNISVSGYYTIYITGRHLRIELKKIKDHFDYALRNHLEVSVLAMLYTRKPERTETLTHSEWSTEIDRMDYKELPMDVAERANVVQLIKDGYQPMIDNKIIYSVNTVSQPTNTLFKIVDMENELLEEDLKFYI